MTTLHVKLCSEGRDTLSSVFDAGWTGYWSVARVQPGDVIRIHWEGNEAEPAGAASFAVTRVEPVMVPGDTYHRMQIHFDKASTHNYSRGWNPPAQGFQPSGIRYTDD